MSRLTASRSHRCTSVAAPPRSTRTNLAEVIERIPVSGERAVEILPTHATPKRLDRLADMGITAVSIGAQSFHDEVLRRLRGPHDATASSSAVQNALGRFACVDVDLIVDVAWESDDALAGAFVDDVRACLELGVDQVSTYPLMRFGYTPFGTAHHDRRAEHAVLAETAALARSMGYERRSVWTLNRRGSAPYTSITRRRYLGMGAGSSSFAGRDFYVNHFGIATYAEAVQQGRLPVARCLHLGKWSGAAYDVFWQAYAGGIDLDSLAGSYGRQVATVAGLGLSPLVPAGLVRRVPSGYRLTERGFDVYPDLERFVTYQFIEPLWAEMLQEHATEPGAAQGRARWVISEPVPHRPSVASGPPDLRAVSMSRRSGLRCV